LGLQDLEISAINCLSATAMTREGSLLVGSSASIHRLSPARYHDAQFKWQPTKVRNRA